MSNAPDDYDYSILEPDSIICSGCNNQMDFIVDSETGEIVGYYCSICDVNTF